MTLRLLIQEARKMNKKKDKEQLIRDFFEDNPTDLELYILKIILDPAITLNFSSKMAKGGVDGDRSIDPFEFLCALEDRSLSGNKAIEQYKNLDVDEETEFAINVALNQEPIGFTWKSVNQALGTTFIDVFECQLADTWKPDKKYKENTFWWTPKLDGLRGVFHADKGKILSRKNHPFHGFNEIEQTLAIFCKEHDIRFVDGEMYRHGMPFQTVQSIVVNDDPEDTRKNNIRFYVFAVVADHIKDCDDMNRHMDILRKLDSRIVVLNPLKITEQEIIGTCRNAMDGGYEGIMLRAHSTPYNHGRSNDLLKVKLFVEDDFEITEVYEGEGKYKGMLGGLCVSNTKQNMRVTPFETKDFQTMAISSCIGSGFTDEDRQLMWENQDDLIGKIASIKYQGLTDDESSLRFPVFLGIKEDR